jgi:ribosomal protein L11 methyltransferase
MTKWLEVKVIFESESPRASGELISEIFYRLGTRGVVVEEPDIVQDDSWASDAIPVPKHWSITGYLPVNEKTASRLDYLHLELERLSMSHGIHFEKRLHEVDEQNWAESWKSYFHAQKIGNRIVIKPTWRSYEAADRDIVIEIDPGMAFGTGTHPTTRLCVQMLENHLIPGSSFLDVGTGSGILMIAAAKLGAVRLCGTDSDEVAVSVARRNLLLNHIGEDRFALFNANLVDGVSQRFDAVAANILSEVILKLLDHVPRVLTENGVFIASGIIEENLEPVIRRMKQMNFHIDQTASAEGWAVVVGSFHP